VVHLDVHRAAGAADGLEHRRKDFLAVLEQLRGVAREDRGLGPAEVAVLRLGSFQWGAPGVGKREAAESGP
jgi:hypothetical protein